ncbi:MAG: cysteine--tRNA ligase [Pseudomonadales bacterium]|nr:cysteine--tRNA ligase [Pseudomonadales bacterium]
MLHIYNTLSRQKERFTPIEPGKVSMYVCGMTVYDYCHLGHARVLVAFDVISRYLRASGYEVNYVRNITDIDDKILRRADENGEAFTELTNRFIDAMHEDERRLGVLSPTAEPRATAYIDEIIAMVATLIDKGFAYAADNGDVYFSVNAFPGYGALSGKKLEDLIEGASERTNIETDKRDSRDFALWKRAADDEVFWPSPWGNGRPGWHIECSAMSTCCLGNTFDIHGGGPDLPFPHHENEIAQSEAATGQKYVNTWMHAGAVRVDNEKMSKSLGNFFTIREILDKYHPEVVRFFLISSHYRSSINYSEDSLKQAKAGLDRFYQCLQGFESVDALPLDELKQTDSFAQFTAAMDDDFNVREAIAVMFGLVKSINNDDKAAPKVAELKGLAHMLGILSEDPTAFLQAAGQEELSVAFIEQQIALRTQAKLDKDYALSDTIRDDLKAQGVELMDAREGTTWKRI